MKKVFLMMAILIAVSTMDAGASRNLRKTVLDIGTRLSFYTDFDDTQFGLGCDFVFNPFKNIGLRVELAELLFNDGTLFSLNHGVFKTFPKTDLLIYLMGRDIQPYLHTGFGLVAGDGVTFIMLGGGRGIDYYINRNFALSLEPGLYFMHASDGTSDSDLLLRISAGAKFGIMP